MMADIKECDRCGKHYDPRSVFPYQGGDLIVKKYAYTDSSIF